MSTCISDFSFSNFMEKESLILVCLRLGLGIYKLLTSIIEEFYDEKLTTVNYNIGSESKLEGGCGLLILGVIIDSYKIFNFFKKIILSLYLNTSHLLSFPFLSFVSSFSSSLIKYGNTIVLVLFMRYTME